MGPSVGEKLSVKQPRSGERSQSEVVGVILIFGLVIAGSFAILALGATAIGDTEDQLSGDRAEKTLTQFDSKAGLVALGESNSQKVSLPERGNEDFSVNGSKGKLTIEVTNLTSGNTASWGDPLIEVELGVVEYENDGTKLAYQGGGVFRVGDGNGTMVSPPEFHFRSGTLTLPIVNITGAGSLGPAATVSHADENRTFPLSGQSNRTNPLDNHEVKLTVQSEYYQGWGRYFEQRTDGSVKYDHADERATLVLRTPAGERTVQDAIAATAASGDLFLRGDGTVDHNTDSYNSSEGSYDDTRNGNGSIKLAGEFEIGSSKVVVNGSVKVGGEASCNKNARIDRSIVAESYVDFSDCNNAAMDGASKQSLSIFENGLNVRAFIENKAEEIKSDPDNDPDISGDEIVFTGGTASLGPGSYYLEKLDASSKTLDLNTKNGEEIHIIVDEYLRISDTDINIKGTGEVSVYINGTDTYSHGSDDYHLSIEDGSAVTTEGSVENSTQFWLYGKDSFEAQLDGSSGSKEPIFEGVIYSPTLSGQPSGMSNVTVSGATIYGGIVAGDITSKQSSIHFDEALQADRAIPPETRIATITFLHITENEIEIE